MDTWEKFQRVRDDDPYHAWMFHRRRTEDILRTGGGKGDTDSEPGPICPMIIKVLPEKGNPLELLESLIEFRKLFSFIGRDGLGPVFFASPYDLQHLNKSIAALMPDDPPSPDDVRSDDEENQTVGKEHDYFRYYLVYAYEKRLFPRTQTIVVDDPPNDVTMEFNYWRSLHYLIKFVGAGITDIVRNDRADIQPPAAPEQFKSAITVIDDSFAFLNAEFVDRNVLADGTKTYQWLFDQIWFQDTEAILDSDVVTGFRVDQDSVAEGIRNPMRLSDFDLYRQSYKAIDGREFVPLDQFSPEHQPLAHGESHGTHVTSRALRVFKECSEDSGKVALNGVAIPVEVTEKTSGSTLGSYILAGIRQAMMWNDAYYDETGEDDDQTPLVINFSYGFRAGPKDGSSKLNCAIAEMIDARNCFIQNRPTALVVPMGNDYAVRGVAYKKLTSQEPTVEVDWVVQPDDRTSSFLEIYARRIGSKDAADLSFELVGPSGDIKTLEIATRDLTDPRSKYQTCVLRRGETYAAEWSEWKPEADSHWDRRVFLALGPTQTFDNFVGSVPDGRWRLKITSRSANTVELLAMVQRDDTPGSYPQRGRQSFLDHRDAWQPGSPNDDGRLRKTGAWENLGGPLAHAWTASSFSSVASNFVFAVGAGTGEFSDGVDPTTGQEDLPVAVKASTYAAEGPRSKKKSWFDSQGPDYSGLADRSAWHRGIYAAGTYSGTDVLLGGSSVAAPEFAGLCAALPDLIKCGKAYFQGGNHENPPKSDRPNKRFGLIKEAIKT